MRECRSPDELARVRHERVELHDVKVVGVAGEDAFDQITRARGGAFRMNCCLTVEQTITHRQPRGSRRSIHTDRRERTVSAASDTPGVEEHPSEITGVIGVEMREKHGIQACKIEAGINECRRRPATTVDHEDTPVHQQR
jgi:hypothetical protein